MLIVENLKLQGEQVRFVEELHEAIGRYGEMLVDIVLTDSKFYATHTGNNSFPVTRTYDLSVLTRDMIEEIADFYDVAIMED